MYRFCKVFHCTPEEYKNMPIHETRWLLEIDNVWNAAVKEAQNA